MNKMVEVNKLSFKVNDKLILDGIDLSVEENSIVGIVGPNGSGKTTMLKHFYRAIEPEKSTVFISGQDIQGLNFKDSAKIISVMRQENPTDFRFTVLDMVLLGRSPYLEFFQPFSNEDRELAYIELSKVGMTEYLDEDYRVLSGGEKQRVLIARSLVQQSEVLILDEPTNHLDIYYQLSLMEIISNLNKTVISVFHDLNLAARFCHKIFVMKSAKIVLGGSPKDVLTEETMRDIFNVQANVFYETDKPYVIYKHVL